MPGLFTSLWKRRSPPSHHGDAPAPSSSKPPPRGLRRFFHRLRAKFKGDDTPPPKENGSRAAPVQQTATETTASGHRPTTCQCGAKNKRASDPDGKLKPHRHSHSSRYPSVSLYQMQLRAELNKMANVSVPDNTDSTSGPSSNQILDGRRWSCLETNLPRARPLGQVFPSSFNRTSLAKAMESSVSIDEPELLDEREKALRILESRDSPVNHRACSPDTVRRRRQSYRLATDPRIDPQQYSDFRHFLEQEIATDLALRQQIWKSLTQDLGNRTSLLGQPDYTTKFPDSETVSPTDRKDRRRSCSSIGHGARCDGHSQGVEHQHQPNRRHSLGCPAQLRPENAKSNVCSTSYASTSAPRDDYDHDRHHDRPLGTETYTNNNRKSWRNSASYRDLEERLPAIDTLGEPSCQCRHGGKRQRWADQGILRRPSLDRKRASTSSFTQVVSQYIRPERPTSIYQELHREPHGGEHSKVDPKEHHHIIN